MGDRASSRRDGLKIAHLFQRRGNITTKNISPVGTTAIRRFVRPYGTTNNFRPNPALKRLGYFHGIPPGPPTAETRPSGRVLLNARSKRVLPSPPKVGDSIKPGGGALVAEPRVEVDGKPPCCRSRQSIKKNETNSQRRTYRFETSDLRFEFLANLTFRRTLKQESCLCTTMSPPIFANKAWCD
jgi:hypothetical protein